jgi:AraC-like DNA-binding protein
MQVFGKSLMIIKHLRMQEAARLMKQEHLSVFETAYTLGFTNVSYFRKII